MHPSARLIVWLLAVMATQWLPWPGLLVLSLTALLTSPGAPGLWLGYCRRARWLLATLWLILAWHAPGEAWLDLEFLPTREGLAEATLQAVRLLTVFACLAWVYAGGGREGVIAGLWGLLSPWRRFAAGGERLVVRLALVLDNAQRPHPEGAWKQWLAAGGQVPVVAPDVLTLSLPRWRFTDLAMLMLAGGGLCLLFMFDGGLP